MRSFNIVFACNSKTMGQDGHNSASQPRCSVQSSVVLCFSPANFVYSVVYYRVMSYLYTFTPTGQQSVCRMFANSALIESQNGKLSMFATHVNLCKFKALYESGTTMNQNHQVDKSLQCFKILNRYAKTLVFSTRRSSD